METAVLAAIGAAAVYYVVRMLWKEANGENQCSCASGCSNKSCCGDKKNKK
ncbi:MAG: FeoB-associated Cys-rich membrane protein [Veillonellales bacterium]